MTAIDTSTEAVERLLDGVTPGPWRIKNCDTFGDRCTNYFQEIWNDETDILVTTEVTRAHNDGGAKNMRFIRAARDLVPALLKERDEARAALAASQPADPVANAGCCQALLKERDEARARADRAEVALAAQIEVDARIADSYADQDYCALGYPEDGGIAASGTADMIRREIRNQPHDRTALDQIIADTWADVLQVPEVQALIEAAKDAKLILAEHEPYPLKVCQSVIAALRAIGEGEAWCAEQNKTGTLETARPKL